MALVSSKANHPNRVTYAVVALIAVAVALIVGAAALLPTPSYADPQGESFADDAFATEVSPITPPSMSDGEDALSRFQDEGAAAGDAERAPVLGAGPSDEGLAPLEAGEDDAPLPDPDALTPEGDGKLSVQEGATEVSTESDLRAAIAAGGTQTIVLVADITMASPSNIALPSNSDITITASGSCTLKVNAGANYAFYVWGGNSLTFGEGLTVDGNGTTIVQCTGGSSLTFDGATLKNGGGGQITPASIHVTGEGSSFTFASGVVEDCTVGATGVICIDNKATGTMSGGTLRNCRAGVAATVTAAAAILVRSGAAFTMSGGSVTGNRSENGVYAFASHGISLYGASFTMTGGLISGNGPSNDVFSKPYASGGVTVGGGSTFDMSGGEIKGNFGTHGGGVLCTGGTVTMGGSAIVSNNKAYTGGGLYFHKATFTMNGGTVSDNYAASFGGGVLLQVGSAFDMNGGVVSGNEGDSGGGLYIAETQDVTLRAGLIENNKAERHGQYQQGGVYGYGTGGGITVANTNSSLTMSDVLITGNSTNSVGGGAWLCPTGDVESQISDGIAMFDNTAAHAADDLAVVSTGTGHKVDVIQGRMLGGGVAVRYVDGEVNTTSSDIADHGDGSGVRYRDGRRDVFDYSTWDGLTAIALHNDPDANAKELARQRARLVIRGNSSQASGGGIASNGHVIVGRAESKSVVVTKSWGLPEGASPEAEVTVMLEIEGAKDDIPRAVETVKLNAANNWTHTFEGLPVKARVNLEEAAVTAPGWTTYYKESFSDERTIDSPDADEPGTEQTTYYALEDVKVTNARVGTLKISKAVEGDLADPDQEFEFRVTILNPEDELAEPIVDEQSGEETLYAPYEGRVDHLPAPLDFAYTGDASGVLEGGTGIITLKGGQSVTVQGIPHGAYYRVQEVASDADGYEIEPVRGDGARGHAAESGTIEGDAEVSLKYVNLKDSRMGSLRVSKEVAGDAADPGQLFHFQVLFYHPDGSELGEGEFAYVGAHEGVIGSGGMFALRDGESVHIDGIPTGTRWVVSEVAHDAHGYEIEPSSGEVRGPDAEQGTISSGVTSELAYTNVRNHTMGALAISKKVADAAEEGPADEFGFTLRLASADGADLDDAEFAYTGSREGVVRNGGAFSLKHGERIVVEGLPAGTRFQVEETDAGGYESTYEGCQGTVVAAQTAEASVLNVKPAEPADVPSKSATPLTGDALFVVAAMLACMCALAALAAALALAVGRANR